MLVFWRVSVGLNAPPSGLNKTVTNSGGLCRQAPGVFLFVPTFAEGILTHEKREKVLIVC